jgi:hypothetical protein
MSNYDVYLRYELGFRDEGLNNVAYIPSQNYKAEQVLISFP